MKNKTTVFGGKRSSSYRLSLTYDGVGAKHNIIWNAIDQKQYCSPLINNINRDLNRELDSFSIKSISTYALNRNLSRDQSSRGKLKSGGHTRRTTNSVQTKQQFSHHNRVISSLLQSNNNPNTDMEAILEDNSG